MNLFKQKKSDNGYQTNLDQKLVAKLSKKKMPNFRQLKYLPHFLSDQEKKQLKKLSLILLLFLALFGIYCYFHHLTPVPAKSGNYSEGLVGLPQYINPIFAPSNDVDLDLTKLIFSGLLKFNKAGQLVPDLAEYYEVSPDQKTYTFFLRRNALWHDKERVTADDVIFTIKAIQNPKFRSPLISSLEGIKVEEVDTYKVRFILNKPFSPFLANLTFGILPKHIWQDIPAEQSPMTEYNLKPIGSGPFKFKGLTKDERGLILSYIMERNENYYGQIPYLEKVTFRFYLDYQEAIEDLKVKKIDGLSYSPKNLKEKLETLPNLKHYSLDFPSYMVIFLNQETSLFKSKEIRQALFYAINRTKIINDVLAGEAKIINGPISPSSFAFKSDLPNCPFDPQKSEEILVREGWKLNEETNVRQKKKEDLVIKLTTVAQTENQKVAEMVKEDWQRIGIKVLLEVIPRENWQKEIIKPRNYEALLSGIVEGADPDPFPLWHSTQIPDPGLNLSGFANRRVDELLEKARITTNLEERKALYFEFQDIIANETPAIFLYGATYSYLLDEKVRGVEAKRITTPADRFANIEEWYTKTHRERKNGSE